MTALAVAPPVPARRTTGPVPPPSAVDPSLAAAEVARRVLADNDVRSVTIEPAAGGAAIHFRDHRVEVSSVRALAERFRRDDALLGSASLLGLPAIDSYADEATGRRAFVRRPTEAVGWRRVMHLGLAGLWFTLAMIGVVVPGMPTTCFLLMTSYSLLRSSRRLHERLLASRVFGPSLRHWRLYRGVRPGVKARALSVLVLVTGATVLLSGLPAAAQAGITAGASIGAFCILRLRVVEG
ncbi:MAG: YbaN family protein [Lacipirellulaceae bacterium]